MDLKKVLAAISALVLTTGMASAFPVFAGSEVLHNSEDTAAYLNKLSERLAGNYSVFMERKGTNKVKTAIKQMIEAFTANVL